MPEHRARKHHQDRVAETLRLEIGTMIEGELSDPRIHLCYVSEVALNPGGKSARVYVAVDSAVKNIAGRGAYHCRTGGRQGLHPL